MKLNIYVYLRTKFQVSSIILISVRQGGEGGEGEGGFYQPPHSTSKRTSKEPTKEFTHIRVKYKCCHCFLEYTNLKVVCRMEMCML